MNVRLNLSQMSRRTHDVIAQQNTRTHCVVEAIWAYVQQLTDASTRSDWPEVQRLARLIVLDSLVFGVEDMQSAAEQLEHEVREAPGSKACQRGVDRLRSVAKENLPQLDSPRPQEDSDEATRED